MRVFIAVELEEKLKTFLGELQREFNRHFTLKDVAQNNLHITLSFIRTVKKENLEKLKEILEALRQQFKGPIDLMAKKAMFGPTKSNPRLVWVEVESKKIVELKNFIDSKFLQDKYLKNFVEKRPFRPHITISRLKLKTGVDKKIFEKEIDFSFKSSSTKITLFQSILKPTGAEYEPLLTVNLS